MSGAMIVTIVDSSGNEVVLAGNVTSLGNITIASGNITNTVHVTSTFVTNQIVVGNTSTALFGSGNQTTYREVYNSGNQTVYLGNTSVTTSNGHGLPALGTFKMNSNSAALDGIVASGNVTVTVIGW